MPNIPDTDTKYDLTDYAVRRFIRYETPYDADADEKSINIGCEFGFHFPDDVMGRLLKPWVRMIFHKTLHCKDGLWDIDNEALTEFPPCINGEFVASNVVKL